MTASIWLDKHSRLKSFSAAVKGAKSIIKIEIECSEPASLGYLLERLYELEKQQKGLSKTVKNGDDE